MAIIKLNRNDYFKIFKSKIKIGLPETLQLNANYLY